MSTVGEKRDVLREIMGAGEALRPEGFGAQRAAARAALLAQGLPGSRTEEYRFTPIVRSLEKAIATWSDSNEATQPVPIDAYILPGVDVHVIALINGQLSGDYSKFDNAAFRLSPLSAGAASGILFAQADAAKDPFTALNTALWTGGVHVRVPKGVLVDKPIMLLDIADNNAGPRTTNARVVVEVEEGASLSLITKRVATGTQPVFSTLIHEVVVGEKGRLDYCSIQDSRMDVMIEQTFIRQLDDSHVNTFTLTLDGKLVRNNLTIAIDGKKCESHFHGLYLLKDDTIADNHTVVDHRQPNSFSNELYKGVMDGKAKGIFNGKIYVRPDAQKTNAFQSNRNILLGDQATVNTKPQLEIWADDVKCSHGCTTGQLDEDALFYLRSRGIQKDHARAMLLYAFAAETFSFVANEQLKAYIDKAVSARLHKDF